MQSYANQSKIIKKIHFKLSRSNFFGALGVPVSAGVWILEDRCFEPSGSLLKPFGIFISFSFRPLKCLLAMRKNWYNHFSIIVTVYPSIKMFSWQTET